MMNLARLALVVVGLLTACAPGWAEVPGLRFDGTKWIWYSADATESSPRAPAGICYFRSGVDVSEKTQITAAEVFITADNLFTLYLNDKLVGQSETNPNAWNRPKRFDVTGLLFPGTERRGSGGGQHGSRPRRLAAETGGAVGRRGGNRLDHRCRVESQRQGGTELATGHVRRPLLAGGGSRGRVRYAALG